MTKYVGLFADSDSESDLESESEIPVRRRARARNGSDDEPSQYENVKKAGHR